MSLILMCTRRLAEGERLIRAQKPWAWGMNFMLGVSIQGRQLGLVGMGAIAVATARRARAFGMTIAYTKRSLLTACIALELDAKLMDMDMLLATSDVVSLHCPYSADTHHLISEPQLAKMKRTAFIINTARGPIIDEAALVDALLRKVIAGAGLDVFEQEPIVHAGLLDMPNVVLLPHLGSATLEARQAMANTACINCLAILEGSRPPNLVE